MEDVSLDCTVFFLERLVRKITTTGQVFWLPDLTTDCTFPQLDDRRIKTVRLIALAVVIAAFVPGYSGGTATDSHRLPYSSPRRQAAGDTQVFARPGIHCRRTSDVIVPIEDWIATVCRRELSETQIECARHHFDGAPQSPDARQATAFPAT
jgi:hypothetical protein